MIIFVHNISQTIHLIITIIKDSSQIFYYTVGGIGLLLAGIGAIRGTNSWRSSINEKRIVRETDIKNKTEELKAKYPKEMHEKTFQLIASKLNPRPKYLLDKNTDTKHWIASRSTFDALEFQFDWVKKLNQKEFDLIQTGEKILIE